MNPLAAFLVGTAAAAAIITGAGATFPYPLYAKWAEAYQARTGVAVNYQSIGSGGGIKQIVSGTVDFGASDAPLSPERLEAEGLVQFPTVLGGVVPVVHLAGVASGTLRLTGPVLADIYLGTITRWNDPRIAAENPGLALPDRAIVVIHRADGSGTTFLFSNYLSKVSPTWRAQVGEGTALSWPVGIGGKGNEGVAMYVQRIPGSIGYVESAFALQVKLPYALVQNAAGRFVPADVGAFQAAAEAADWRATPGFGVILTNQPGPGAWPITGATFVLVHRRPADPGTTRDVLGFFAWAYEHGDDMARDLHYAPMPDPVVRLVHDLWANTIRAPDGSALWAVRGTRTPRP